MRYYVLIQFLLLSFGINAQSTPQQIEQQQELLKEFDHWSKRDLRFVFNQSPIPVTEGWQKILDGLPADHDRLWFEVPLDYSNPQSKLIWVFANGRIQDAIKNQSMTPVIFYHGGPGGTSSGITRWVSESKPDLTHSAPIFLSDRGSGANLNGCGTLFEKEVQKASYYEMFMSTSIVRDAEMMRQNLLGSKPWKVVGQSYGQIKVHAHIGLFPGSIISAHIDAYAYAISSQRHGILKSYYLAERLLKFFNAHPDLRDRIHSQIENSKEQYSSQLNPTCQISVLQNDELEVMFDPDSWEVATSLLDRRLNSTTGVVGVPEPPFAGFAVLGGEAANYALWYLDLTTPDDGPVDPNGYFRGELAAYKWLLAQDPKTARILRESSDFGVTDDPWAIDFRYQIFLDRKKYPIQLGLVKENVDHYKIPFFLYAGISDTNDSPYLFCDEATFLGDSVKFKLRKLGHALGFLNPEFWEDVYDPTDPDLDQLIDADEYCKDAMSFALSNIKLY